MYRQLQLSGGKPVIIKFSIFNFSRLSGIPQAAGQFSKLKKFRNLLVNWVIVPMLFAKNKHLQHRGSRCCGRLLDNSRWRAGFTLIELLISIVIIAILMSVSFAGFARLNQRQTVITAGQNLKNIIRDAQSRANNSEVDCSPTKCNCSLAADIQFSGWYVDFSSQKIYGKCAATNFGDKDFGLSTEIVISPYVTPVNQLIFKNNPLSASGKSTICVSNPNLASSYYVIRVNNSGSISDDGGLVSTCNP